MKDKLKKILLKIKYSSKAQRFSISNDLLDYMIERFDNNLGEKDIFDLVNKSKNKTEFNNNIISFFTEIYQKKEHGESKYYASMRYVDTFLMGNLTGKYLPYVYKSNDSSLNSKYVNNFTEDTFKKVVPILKENFYDYIMNNNKNKNKFCPYEEISDGKVLNFGKEVDEKYVLDIFDKVVSGEINFEDSEELDCAVVAEKYITTIMGNYPINDILNNFDFIKKDLKNIESEKNLEERKEEYEKQKELSEIEINYIKNIDNLITRIDQIDNNKGNDLKKRLLKIKDAPIENIDELSDIYLEYEILFREDIVDHLFVPNEEITLIDNFQNLRPQMIHLFLRNPEQFEKTIRENIKKEIISERKDSNESEELTEKEKIEFERRVQSLDAESDQSQVNYSFKNIGVYSDSIGLSNYKSNTENQISASIYSENYFLARGADMVGIGFNKETLTPEAIALSSKSYLTTNKGINNLEYNEQHEFELMSCTYNELIKNDGKSEVVLFRRNMDYDTKAAYIFCTIDSSKKDNNNIIEECMTMAKKNKLKLVIYDLYKIRNSYNEYLNEQNNIEQEENIKHSI